MHHRIEIPGPQRLGTGGTQSAIFKRHRERATRCDLEQLLIPPSRCEGWGTHIVCLRREVSASGCRCVRGGL